MPSNGFALADLGWGSDYEESFRPFADAGLEPGRVAVQHRGAYDVYAESGEFSAEVSGRLRFEAAGPLDLPAVGDWVALRHVPGARRAVIDAVLPRRTVFVRKSASDQHRGAEEQVVAANVESIFVVSALVDDFNTKRIERYLVLAWESGARPAIVLTKADLCADVEARVAEVELVALGVPVHVVSNVTGEGIDALRPYFAGGETVAALGSSGVGKSTLINQLAGDDLQAVGAVRADGRGRHTTTRRELILVPGGGLFLDTPGMREIQLWEAPTGVEEAFDDIAELAGRCRFADCAHAGEPGCEVRAALDAGTLEPSRLDSYRKLLRELEHLERRLDVRAQSERRKEYRRTARSRRRVSW